MESRNAYDILKERGFVKQIAATEKLSVGETKADRTEPETLIRKLLDAGEAGQVTYYVGFDPTADSLHCGSLMPIMAMAHLQRAGHRPIAVIGGGTTMVGDPSGKTELRRMMTREEIQSNGVKILGQLQRYLDLGDSNSPGAAGTKGLFLDNADWLLPLRYVDFLREIGRHFRVNEMVKAESYRARLEREEGLSFIEFNYQLLQAYDFLKLFQDHKCVLQMGGDDQWSNMLAGADLIRRMHAKTAYALTFPLLATARGEKMGKTAGGAVWLDAARTSPYEFYQYWINTDDRDVARFLAYFTFLPMDEVKRLGAMKDAAIREAKEILAYEATKLCHGEAEADKARGATRAAFSGEGGDLSAVPTSNVTSDRIRQGIPLIELLVEVGLTSSKSEARKLIEQGGAYVNGKVVSDVKQRIDESSVEDGVVMLRFGKKKHHRVVVK